MRILILAAACVVLACDAHTFTGESGALQFESNLNRQWRSWHPPEHVAQGAAVEFTALRALRPGGGWDGAATVCTVTGAALVGSPDAGPNRVVATAANEGSSEVTCSGNAFDRFTVVVSAPASVRARDELHHYARWYETVPSDGGLRELEQPLILTADAKTWIALEVFSADGGFINGVPDRYLDPVTDGGFFSRIVNQQLQLEVPELAGEREVAIRALVGGEIGTVRVRTARLDEAARLWLVTWQSGDSLTVVKAAVEVADGGEWVQPPVSWSWNGDIALFPADSGVDLQSRRDVRVFQAASAPPDGGRLEGDVTATIGGLSATTRIGFEIAPVPGSPVASSTGTPPTGICGCGAGAGGSMVLLVVVLPAFRRRRAFP